MILPQRYAKALFEIAIEKSLIEFNMDEIDERTIRDSSGHGLKGMLLGDYAIIKESKEIKVRRDSDIIFPEIGIEDKEKAF